MSLLLALFFALPSQGRSPTDSCEIRNERALTMPPLRSQDSTGYCYAFSGVALIQHKYCRAKGGCKYSGSDPAQDDRLSVLDANWLANYGGGGITDGGQIKDVINSVRREGGLFRESCAPFSVYINNERPLPGELRSALKSRFDAAHKRFQDPGGCPPEEKSLVADSLRKALGLSADIKEIIAALEYRDRTIALGKLLIPESCQKRRVKLPPIGRPNSVDGDSFPAVQAKIDELLAKGTPLNTNLCAFPPRRSARGEAERPNVDNCGLHALVISGVRECCKAGACTKEYQFYDSATTFNGIARPGNWVPEDVFRERLERKWKRTTDRENLVWID